MKSGDFGSFCILPDAASRDPLPVDAPTDHRTCDQKSSLTHGFRIFLPCLEQWIDHRLGGIRRPNGLMPRERLFMASIPHRSRLILPCFGGLDPARRLPIAGSP
jgi:hypothetical protein